MMRTHTGGCHCGRVRFEVIAPAAIEVDDCDCSMCSKFGFLHLIVPKERFKLLSGGDALTTYTFNTQVAKHLFCATCGVKSFYIPRSHPDGISVNARCIDAGSIESMTVIRSTGATGKTAARSTVRRTADLFFTYRIGFYAAHLIYEIKGKSARVML